MTTERKKFIRYSGNQEVDIRGTGGIAYSVQRIGMPAVDNQMTTSFFTLQPVRGWETNHSQMTTRIYMFRSTANSS